MYKCWLKSALHYRHKEVSAVSDFFRATDTYDDVVLRLIGSDTSQGLYLVSVFESCPKIMVTMEKLYVQDNLPDRRIFAEFVNKYCHRADYDRFSQTIYKVEGKTLPKLPPIVDYEEKRKEASYEYLSCLFDEKKYQTLIESLILNAEDTNITVDKLNEVLSSSDFNSTNRNVVFAINRYSYPSWFVKDFLS